MHRSVLLRVVALFCLGAVFHDSAVQAGEGSTSNEPATVKDILDFLGKLGNDNGLKEKLSKQVDEKVQVYVDTNEIPGKSIKENLDELLKKISELRKNLLKEPNSYGNYANVQASDADNSAIANLIKWLPILHSELWFLFYETATDCVGIGGNKWATQTLRGTGGKDELHKWLTDKFDKKDIPFIRKGFSDNELHESNRGDNIAATTGVKFHQGEPLNYAQYGLFFLSPTWHDSNLASTVLFLQEFCSEVNKDDGKFKDKLSEEKYKGLKTACETLSVNLKSLFDQLWPLYSPLTDREDDKEETEEAKEEVKKATEGKQDNVHKNIYEGKLKSESFDKYVEWLVKNLDVISDSLKDMVKSSWSKDELSNATLAGPFKYGFVFKESNWDDNLYYKLKSTGDNLTKDDGPIKTLLKSLGYPQKDHVEAAKGQSGGNHDASNQKEESAQQAQVDTTNDKNANSSEQPNAQESPGAPAVPVTPGDTDETPQGEPPKDGVSEESSEQGQTTDPTPTSDQDRPKEADTEPTVSTGEPSNHTQSPSIKSDGDTSASKSTGDSARDPQSVSLTEPDEKKTVTDPIPGNGQHLRASTVPTSHEDSTKGSRNLQADGSPPTASDTANTPVAFLNKDQELSPSQQETHTGKSHDDPSGTLIPSTLCIVALSLILPMV